MFRLGQPLHQIIIVLLVAVIVAATFLYGAMSNEKPLEAGGQVWASSGLVNIALAIAGLIAFAIAFPLMMALRARLTGRQNVRMDSRRVIYEGVHFKGTLQFHYVDIARSEISHIGHNAVVLIQKKDGQRMNIPLPLFADKDDPHRLVAMVNRKIAEAVT